MTSQPSRNRSRWSLDFSKSGRSSTSDLPSPPGYSTSVNALHGEAARQADPSLRAKRSWEIALGPIKQIPMNGFIMWMSGNTISIFPIMMVVMMTLRPIKTLFSVNSTFKAIDVADGGGGVVIFGQKFVYVIGNLLAVLIALYKCHSMGLLPTHTSDWLAFADPVFRAEWAYA